MHGSPKFSSSISLTSPKGATMDDFLLKHANFAQQRLTQATSTAEAQRGYATHLEEELLLYRERSEEAASLSRKEAAARVQCGEAVAKASREREAALAQAQRLAQRASELEAERAATKKVLLELYSANGALEAENRSLQQGLAAQEAALRAGEAQREALEAERARAASVATAAREVAAQSMTVAEAAEEERDALLAQVTRLRTLLKRTHEAASAAGLTLPSYTREF